MFTKTTGRALYREVVNQICERILMGQIKKGDLLPSEQTLCKEMGVSRTTVREALRILKERDIIETVQGKGSIVLQDDFSYFDESARASLAAFQTTLENAVQARLLLEPQIAKLACRNATEKDIREMTDIIALCDEKEKAGALSSADLRTFHYKVADSAHNPVLKSLVDILIPLCDAPADSGVIVPAPDPSGKTEINITHEAILNAIRQSNEEDAYFYMKENIKQFYRNALKEMGSV